MAEGRNYWTRQRVSRRGMLRGAAVGSAGLAGAVLIGCGGDDDGTATPGASGTAAATSTAGGGGAATATPDGGGAGAMTPVSGGILSLVSNPVYDSVDAQTSVSSPVLTITSRAQSKLLRFTNPNSGEVVGDLIESWEVVSPTEVVLNMRQGVTWHDAGPGADNPASTAGRPLTTEDIKWNIERQQKAVFADGSAGNFGRKSFWNKIQSMEITDKELRFTLGAPDATFVEGMANEFNTINQPELAESVGANFSEITPDKVIGTGPFILTEWRPGERVSGVRNPKYYDPARPYLDGFVLGAVFDDPTAYRIGFEQNQIDYFSDPDPDTTLAIQASNADTTNIRWSGVANTVAAYTNTNIAPFNDLRLAQAIDLALDRRLIIQQLHNGYGRVSGPISWLQEKWAFSQERLQTQPGYQSGAERDADVAEANKLWQAAGGADVGEISWTIADSWASRASWNATPELIVGMFNDAFSTKQFVAKTAPYGEIIPSWANGTFDNFFAWISNVEIPDARADLLAAFGTGSPANFWNISKPDEIDAPLAAAVATTDLDEALELVNGVQDYILENGQFGRHIAYNYIFPSITWNHYHTTGPADGEGWNFISSSLGAVEEWIDQTDPSFDGRQSPSVTPV